MKTIYSVGYNDYCHLDSWLSKKTKTILYETELTEKDSIVILHGGEDISPSLYNQLPRYTHASKEPSLRDEREWNIIDKAIKLQIPILGICRGAQLLTAYHGGTLIQDVNNHVVTQHLIETRDNWSFSVNSLHHQMCNIFELPDVELIGWTKDKVATEFKDLTPYKTMIPWTSPEFRDPEIFYFKSTNCLGVQSHPEMLPEKHLLNTYLKQFISKQMLG